MPEHAVIASVIVQARRERLPEIVDAIGAMPGTEVHASDPAGRIVVVLERASDGDLGADMLAIGELEGVLGVNLVFHHSEPTVH